MKKISLFIAFLCFSFILNASDRVVDESGGGGSFTSISAAVFAASDGDRIIIKNKSGNAPWVENVTVNKSLEFLSFQNDTFFVVQGNFTIIPASGRTVSFIGMKNVSGNITSSTNGPVGARTVVTIAASYLVLGGIDFDYSNYDVNLVGSRVDAGSVKLQHGSIVGNQLSCASDHSVIVTSDGTQNGDVLRITGNRIYNTSPGYYGININTSSNFFEVSNNYIKHSGQGIQIYGGYPSSSTVNLIQNNTIETYSLTNLGVGIHLYNIPASAIVELKNNVIDESTSGASYAVFLSLVSGTVNLKYNYIDISHTDYIFGTPALQLNTDTTTSFTLLADGKLDVGSAAIDGADPDVIYTDLDLTPGDAGGYGGSFTLDNYFPIFLGSARVYNVLCPDSIRKGTALSIIAQGYSRNTGLVSGESYWDADPGFGNGFSAEAVDGSYNEVIEVASNNSVLTGYLNVGLHVLYTRAKDTSGFWGPSFGVVVKLDTFAQPVPTVFGPLMGFCASGNLTGDYFVDSVATYSYEWTVTGGSFATDSTKPAVKVDWDGSGPYTLQVKECNSFGCDSTEVTVSVLNVVAPTVSSNSPVCEGDTLYLNAGVVSGATAYLWNGPASFVSALKDNVILNIAATAAGTYSVSASVNGCLGDTSNTVVVVLPAPLVPVVTQIGDTLISSLSDSIQWYYNGDSILGATNDTLMVTQTGTYTAVTTNLNGCSSASAPYSYIFTGVHYPVGMYDQLSVYPNPSNGIFDIYINASGSINTSIINVLGKVVFEETTIVNGKFARTIDLKYPAGVYLLRIQNGERSLTQKLIIE